MAAATAGSSSGGGAGGGSPADSYIGSLISLTSKSEIRYEGVLFNINTHDSTIGLRNVRSFGTEGRKKDGPQVPASDKIYEFILFRGSDIKDLQVKSSPPVQSTTPIHNDPAIIQSHYPQVTSVSTSLPASGTGSVPDFNSHNTSLGVSRPTFPSSLPLYQPGQNLGSWGSSHPPPPPSANGSGLSMPMYWQGYYGPSNGMQAQQQTLFQGPPELSVPPSVRQPTLYPSMNSTTLSTPLLSENPPPLMPPFSTGNMNLQSSTLATLYPPMNSTTHSTPMLSENPPPLSPPLSTSIMNLQSSTPSMRSSAIVLDSANSIPDKPSGQALPAASLSSNLSLVSPLTTALEKSGLAEPGFDKPKTVMDPVMPFKSISEPPSRIMEASNSILGEGAKPSLVTPGQFVQPGPPTVPSGQSPQNSQKDVEVVQMSPVESPPLPKAAAGTEKLEPILPLPTQTERKLHGAPMYTNHASRGGRERGRGNGISSSATRFTEDFDFTAMNEKFNKDEVWGHLGKSNKAQEDGEDLQDEDDSPLEKFDKPVYVKDDFFDSLSCDALGGGLRGGRGRGRFSEQMRRDTETFGDFSRNRGGRGGWAPGRGGRSRGGGGYHGRGYGYVGRGRGYGMPGRAI